MNRWTVITIDPLPYGGPWPGDMFKVLRTGEVLRVHATARGRTRLLVTRV